MSEENEKAVLIIEMLQRGGYLNESPETEEMLIEFIEEILSRKEITA